MGLPTTLREVGIDESRLAEMAQKAAANMGATFVKLTAEDVETRVQLIQSMGISRICISDWDAAGESFLAGLN